MSLRLYVVVVVVVIVVVAVVVIVVVISPLIITKCSSGIILHPIPHRSL